MSGWSHLLWAGIGAALMFPLKKIWDSWISEFWTGLWVGFKAGFQKTPAGQEFFKTYHDARAKKDAEIVTKYPELEKLLHCKECQGKGCEECGGTGWV